MAELTAEQELAALATELANNPSTRKQFLGLVKTARPDTVLPELDSQDAIAAIRSEYDGKLQALEEKFRSGEVTGALEKRRDAVRQKYRMADDELTRIEDDMRAGKFNDHETAAEFHALQKRMSVPTPQRHHRAKPFEGIDIDAFQKDPEGAALDEMYRAIDELNSGAVRLQ